MSCVVGTQRQGRRVPIEWGTAISASTIIRQELIFDEPLPPEGIALFCGFISPLVCQPQEGVHLLYVEITENKLILEAEMLVDTLVPDPPEDMPGVAYVYKIIPSLDLAPLLLIGGGLLLIWFMGS